MLEHLYQLRGGEIPTDQTLKELACLLLLRGGGGGGVTAAAHHCAAGHRVVEI